MLGTNWDYGSDAGRRFDALIVGSDDAADTVSAVIAQAGGRVLPGVSWNDALDRLQTLSAVPVVVLNACGVAEDTLADILPAIDHEAAGRGLPLVIGTDMARIDVVAASLAAARYEIVCDPSALDWIAAIAACGLSDRFSLGETVRENEAARLARLNAEVARIAEVLARLSTRGAASGAAPIDRSDDFASAAEDAGSSSEIRQIVRARRQRDRHLGPGLFEDPGWDMMLDLYAAHLERAQVSVSSLCIAAAVAPTTALRWIARMTDAGIFRREPDPFDRRRAFMFLTPRGLEGMRRYIASLRAMGLPLV
ncbi:hypothetical protein F1C10_06435 [Sphingomonas sp. NBWT7]|uniref:hypothetical protein n=1 Tax=Sphingomonas sp. NBWT7 TaxID=2596913 RepID=UPI0016251CB8|nr:hypothetical protein [Sphingomonas sp. NBWT7]QNE31601.1 hypothetical protein F1C10_06435 [Sphingomonas sp. NBWT7]